MPGRSAVRPAPNCVRLSSGHPFYANVLYNYYIQGGIAIGLAIMLGDVVDDGGAVGAERDLVEVARELHSLGVPVLAVPGNHDGDPQRYGAIFGNGPGLFRVRDHGFYVFRDWIGPGDVTVRPPGAVRIPLQLAAQAPGLPLVALQHNPLHPRIERDYPYMLVNAETVMDAYREAKVVLSLSGHYHPGQAAHEVDGVTYYTVPALCEAPFRFAHLHLAGRSVQLHEYTLEDVDRNPNADKNSNEVWYE